MHKYRNENTGSLVGIPDVEGLTPLHYACSDNNMELVELLLKAGANPKARYYKLGCSSLLQYIREYVI